MNRWFARLLLALFALFFIGLVSAIVFFSVRDNSLKKQIVGSWKTDDSWIFTFGENGRWTISDVTEEGRTVAVYGGKYNIYTDTLTMYTEGHPDYKSFLICDPSFDGDKMSLLIRGFSNSEGTVSMLIRYGDDKLLLFDDNSYIFDRTE